MRRDRSQLSERKIFNAGIGVNGEFEVVPKAFDDLERNILLTAPINITRQFLPLIYGRKHYESIQSTKTMNNGGRIVNITSLAAYFCGPNWTRYGVCKAGLSYFSHTLRMELSPRFGIWVNEVAPGGFSTAIVHNAVTWTKRVKAKLVENKQSHLLQVYNSYTAEEVEKYVAKLLKDTQNWSPDIEPVIDCIVHSLSAKYPERTYRPNWGFAATLIASLPFWITRAT